MPTEKDRVTITLEPEQSAYIKEVAGEFGQPTKVATRLLDVGYALRKAKIDPKDEGLVDLLVAAAQVGKTRRQDLATFLLEIGKERGVKPGRVKRRT